MPARRQNHRVYIISSIFGALAGGAVLPLFALLIWLLQLPVGLSGTFALLAFGFACLISGITAGRLKQTSGLLSGAKSALLLLMVLVVITFVMGNLTGELFLGRLVTAVLCGSVGGVLGVNKR
jgi:putative membrane protein (TIGR04086 family)